MEKISIILITLNEEKNIAGCLESVKWADEIILVDSGSTDKTTEIAAKYTNQIHIKKWEGYSKQKAFALSLTKNRWVLSIDCDERVSKELFAEIEKLKIDNYDGYLIKRKNYFLRRPVYTCGWDNDYQLRLFDKDKTSVSDKLVHEGFTVDGKIKKLEHVLDHYTFDSIENALIKSNVYSTLEAKELYQSNKKITRPGIIFHSLAAFLRFYISLKGFKEGFHGLMVSVLHSITNLQKYTKLWELYNTEIDNPNS